MPNSRYQIQYRDKSGDKHTINDVTNIKGTVGPLEGEGATDFVVLKQDANGKAEAPQTSTGKEALAKMNGSTSEPSGPPDDSNDASGASEPSSSDAPVDSSAPASSPKKGQIPPGLAKAIAARAAAKKK